MINRLLRHPKAIASLFVAMLIPFVPTHASAAECAVDRQNMGDGWFDWYMCHGVAAIDPNGSTCIQENGHYVVVTVTCDVVAVVTVKMD